jgi:PAS domain S-box-containing protein
MAGRGPTRKELLAEIEEWKRRALRAEEALSGTDAQRRAGELDVIFASLTDSVIIYDGEGRVIKANPAAYKLHGLDPFARDTVTREMLLATLNVRHPDGRPCMLNDLPSARALRGESVIGERLIMDLPDQPEQIMEASAAPLKSDGRIWGAVAVWRDITERENLIKELEKYQEHLEELVIERTEELRRSEEQYRRIVETAQEGIWLIDKDFNTVFVNKKMSRMLGYSPEEMLGRNLDEFLGEFGPSVEELKREGIRESYERKIRKKDGTVIWVQASASPIIDEKGGFIGSLAMITDITERKLSELERLRLIAAIESSADAVCVVSTEGIIEYVNPAFEEMTGYRKDELVGRGFEIVRSGKHPKEFYDELYATLRAGKVWHGRFINRKKDGTIYYEENTISPIKDPSGRIMNYVGIKRDVTEKLRLESIAEAVNTMNNMGYIFSGIRHELGNPVNSIKMSISILRKKMTGDDPMLPYLERAMDEIARMEYLLKTLKTFNMYETPEKKEIDMVSFIRDLTALAGQEMKKSGIGLDIVFHEGGMRATADPRALQQVMLNILSNASDAVAGQEEPRIGINVFRMGERVIVRVQDNGQGMSREQQENLFKPFRTTKPQGTGLGLVIARKMLTSMNGGIEVTSALSQGTAVDIFLPAAG